MSRAMRYARPERGAASAGLRLFTLTNSPQGRHQMTDHDRHHYVEAHNGGRTVAAAEVTISEGPDTTVRASFHAESGHMTPGSRATLVDAVLDLPEVQRSARLKATVPLGDGESLDRLRERCEDVSIHPAGSSAILDATLPAGGSPAASDGS